MAKYSGLCVFLFSVCWALTSACTIDESTVTCKSIEDLHKLSTYKDFEIVKINAEDEQLPVITNDAFKGMTKLKGVVFDSKVCHFEPHALRGIDHPFKFYMKSSNVEELPVELFDGVPVHWIMINKSNLKELKSKMFKNNPMLNETYIEGNKLTTIGSDVFSNTNIVKLELSRNAIATVEDGAFSGMKNLKYLDLSMNKLTTFDADKVFDAFNSLEVLHLGDNLLTALTRFSTLAKLKGLVLSRNAIATIDSKSFDKLPNLKGLYVSFNKLTSIPADTLPTSMTVLGVGGNPWTCSYLTELQTWAKNENVKLVCSYEIPSCTFACA